MKNLLTLFLLLPFFAIGQTNTYEEQDIPLFLPEGWSIFGYSCFESIDVIEAFEPVVDKVIIVKDYLGAAYLPEFGYNGIGNLEINIGYQIKLTEQVDGFQFCDAVIPEDGIGQADVVAAYEEGAASVTPEDGITQADVDAAVAAVDITTDNQASFDLGVASVDITIDNQAVADGAYADGAASVTPEDGVSQADLDAAHAMYEGWCASDIDNDGICDADEVSGCMDATACNYLADAEFDDGSCYNNDLGCGCDNPAAQPGYTCDGNIVPQYQVGDLAEGGIIFQINEDGTGLVAAMEDLTEGATDPYGWGFNGYEWGCYGESVNGADGISIGTGYQNTMDIVNQECATQNGGVTAAQAALDAEINGYSDWYLPSKDELLEMYNTIGNGGPEGNIGGFESNWYWSSSEYGNNFAWYVFFLDGLASSFGKYGANSVRIIRAF